MNERDTLRVKHEAPRGLLNVRPLAADWGLARYWPADDLAPYVEHYWVVRWDLAAPASAETLPHPSVHLVIGRGRAEVVGVMRGRFTTTLEGRDGVIGTKFRPGAFRAFVDRPVAVLANRRWPVGEVLGAGAEAMGARVLARRDDEGGPIAAIGFIESFLRSRRPAVDPAMTLAGRIVARIAEDRALTRVDQLVGPGGVAGGMTLRGLQRLFRDYVGATPKWVIQRYRLIEAAERLAAGGAAGGVDLALELGYADQAHFIRDFKRIVGRPPARYARDLRAAPDRG